MSTTDVRAIPFLQNSVSESKEYQLRLITNPYTKKQTDLSFQYQIPNFTHISLKNQFNNSNIQRMRKKLMDCHFLTKIIEERISVGDNYTFYREIFRLES